MGEDTPAAQQQWFCRRILRISFSIMHDAYFFLQEKKCKSFLMGEKNISLASKTANKFEVKRMQIRSFSLQRLFTIAVFPTISTKLAFCCLVDPFWENQSNVWHNRLPVFHPTAYDFNYDALYRHYQMLWQ